MKFAVRALSDLGEDLIFAPERHQGARVEKGGVSFGDLVTLRTERVLPSALSRAAIFDTTHARDGVLDVFGALRDVTTAKSAKRRALPGDLVVSRLRPYLRQIAYVHPEVTRMTKDRLLALSSEFYVLSPRDGGSDLAFLLPFLLSADTQEALAAAQEGGHHPRVPVASLLALPVPRAVVANRAKASATVRDRLGAYYRAVAGLDAVLTV